MYRHTDLFKRVFVIDFISASESPLWYRVIDAIGTSYENSFGYGVPLKVVNWELNNNQNTKYLLKIEMLTIN